MTNEQIRTAVAEALGFEARYKYGGSGASLTWWVKGEKEFDLFSLPKFDSCLNACHEMEKALNDVEHVEFRNELLRICGFNYRSYISATAQQRAEAFLKTKGLWKDES
jgi:hypothetical protein